MLRTYELLSLLCHVYNEFCGEFVCSRHQADLAPVPLSIFRSNSKFNKNSERSSFEYTRPITTIFCTYFILECFEFSWNFEFDRNMLSGTGASVGVNVAINHWCPVASITGLFKTIRFIDLFMPIYEASVHWNLCVSGVRQRFVYSGASGNHTRDSKSREMKVSIHSIVLAVDLVSTRCNLRQNVATRVDMGLQPSSVFLNEIV